MALTTKRTGILNSFLDEVKLLDNQSGITDGEWFRVHGRKGVSIHFSGITDSTCQIRVSNDFSDSLANADHGIQAGLDIIADDMFQLDTNVKYIKVRKTVAGTDSVTATLNIGE